MPRRPDEPGTDNWRRLWKSNKMSHRQRVRAWLRQLSDSPPLPIALTVPLPTSDSRNTGSMTSNLVI